MAEYMERLSRFVSDTRLQGLDPADIAAAKAVVLDTIGAILAGSLLTENRNLAQMASKTGGSGPSTILGRQAEVQAVFATLVNATAGVALEMDEGNRIAWAEATPPSTSCRPLWPLPRRWAPGVGCSWRP